MTNYIVATIKPWNINAFRQRSDEFQEEWHLVESPESLNKLLQAVHPSYIFFPHWSWFVPESITEQYECVCFHMTDVPYGRGGSPLQNLILHGHKDTKLTALRMVNELDAGPVYGKVDLSLSGTAQEIYERAAYRIYDLIRYILEKEPKPIPQKGTPTVFERRKADQSILPESGEFDHLFDYVRMLDAETYPKAYIDYGEFRIEFSKARKIKNGLQTEVIIRKR
ncbi:hypothetical protein N9934_02165 [Desulfosarcina sp.]|nr:hypothetical protein [Desulfosarcina sp.]